MKRALAIIFGVIAADQAAKGLLLLLVTGAWRWAGDAMAIAPFPYMIRRIASWFNIVFTWNPGTAFSLLRGAAPAVMIILTAAIIGWLCRYLFAKAGDARERAALSFIVGGAIGNLIDRLRFGAVIDFIDWHAGAWHWPAFNIADICICAGVGLYAIHYIKRKK